MHWKGCEGGDTQLVRETGYPRCLYSRFASISPWYGEDVAQPGLMARMLFPSLTKSVVLYPDVTLSALE